MEIKIKEHRSMHPIMFRNLGELHDLIMSGATVDNVARYFAKDELVTMLFYFRELALLNNQSQEIETEMVEIESFELAISE
jgi:hypothetical protein